MTARLYRLAPPDRTGWFLGLGPTQLLPLITGLGLGAMILAATESLLIASMPVVAGVVVAFSSVGDEPLLMTLAARLRWLRTMGRRRFEAPLPVRGPHPLLPPAVGTCRLLTDPSDNCHAPAVVCDERAALIAASVRVSLNSPFLLAEPTEQDRLLAAFGDALAPLSRDADRVVSLRWSSFAAPAPTATVPTGLDGPALDSYRQVVEVIGETPHHEVLLTLTMARPRSQPAIECVPGIRGHLKLLAERLTAAGFTSRALDETALAMALRRRLDPAGRGSPQTISDLAEAAGVAACSGVGPLCAVEHWDHVQLDATWHRAFYVLDWPRSGIPAPWMSDLLLALPTGRTFCVVLEPVSIRASRRAVERQAAKLDSDEEQRRRHGFRIGAEHDATRTALAARESELVAGHTEFDFAGIIVLSAATLPELEQKESQARSAAAAAGVEMAPLHGRHATAMGLCLPIPARLAGRSR